MDSSYTELMGVDGILSKLHLISLQKLSSQSIKNPSQLFTQSMGLYLTSLNETSKLLLSPQIRPHRDHLHNPQPTSKSSLIKGSVKNKKQTNKKAHQVKGVIILKYLI